MIDPFNIYLTRKQTCSFFDGFWEIEDIFFSEILLYTLLTLSDVFAFLTSRKGSLVYCFYLPRGWNTGSRW